MNSKIMIRYCLCAILFFTVSCTQSRLAMDYGTSYQLQKYNQILNPEAEKNLEPVSGMSARAAQGSEEKYQKGFEKTEPAITSYQLNIGNIGK